MLISVVIPTQNRPALLLEAIRSVERQTHGEWEVIVVDDGSDPPVPSAVLAEVLGDRVRLVRNSSAQGVPKAKNTGVRAASGEVILLLDDDDLLFEDALEFIASHYRVHPHLDCIFMGVEPFGPYAEGATRSRQAAIDQLLRRCASTETGGLRLFSGDLFDALLVSVPIDFQRPAARRGTWNTVGGFGETSLFSESTLAIKIAASHKTALAVKPLTRWRIHGANFGWAPALSAQQNAMRQLDNALQSSAELLHFFSERQVIANSQLRRLGEAYGAQLFDGAYLYRWTDKSKGLALLARSFAASPQWRHLRLALTYLLPTRMHRERD